MTELQQARWRNLWREVDQHGVAIWSVPARGRRARNGARTPGPPAHQTRRAGRYDRPQARPSCVTISRPLVVQPGALVVTSPAVDQRAVGLQLDREREVAGLQQRRIQRPQQHRRVVALPLAHRLSVQLAPVVCAERSRLGPEHLVRVRARARARARSGLGLG
eukprot:scaffold114618_cov75-Phaeocystis_antarctica.AAC.2